jgi:competence protein ComEC
MTIGIIALSLLRTPLRWAGAGIITLGIVWAMIVRQPDILVAADGGSVGVRARDGSLRVMRVSKDAFLLREWLAGDADPRLGTDAKLNEDVSCDDAGCVVQDRHGDIIALAKSAEAMSDDCARAAVIVTSHQPPRNCAAVIVDRDLLRREGALALTKAASGYAIESNKPRGVDRPWSPAVREAGEGEGAAATSRGLPQKPLDATPAEADLQAED